MEQNYVTVTLCILLNWSSQNAVREPDFTVNSPAGIHVFATPVQLSSVHVQL